MKLKSIGIIGSAVAFASLLGIVLLGVIARYLTHDENATFLTIWGVIFAGGGVLALIEQETSRQTTVAGEKDKRVPASVFQLAFVGFIATLVFMIFLAVLPFGRAVLGTHIFTYVVVQLALAGFSVQFLVRGILLGQGREIHYSLIVIGEAIIRLVLVFPVFFLVQASTFSAVIITSCGSFAWVIGIRTVLREVSLREGKESWSKIFSRFVPLAAGNALLACILTGFPTVVTGIIGSPQGLAILFSIVTISRIPLTLMSPVQTLLIPVATRALVSGESRKLYSLQLKLFTGVIICSVLFAVGGFLFGPWAIRFIFGSTYIAPAWLVAIMLAVSVMLAGALLQVAVFIPLEKYASVTFVWGLTLLATAAAVYFVPGSPTIRGTAGFVTASVASYIISTLKLQSSLKKYGQ